MASAVSAFEGHLSRASRAPATASTAASVSPSSSPRRAVRACRHTTHVGSVAAASAGSASSRTARKVVASSRSLAASRRHSAASRSPWVTSTGPGVTRSSARRLSAARSDGPAGGEAALPGRDVQPTASLPLPSPGARNPPHRASDAVHLPRARGYLRRSGSEQGSYRIGGAAAARGRGARGAGRRPVGRGRRSPRAPGELGRGLRARDDGRPRRRRPARDHPRGRAAGDDDAGRATRDGAGGRGLPGQPPARPRAVRTVAGRAPAARDAAADDVDRRGGGRGRRRRVRRRGLRADRRGAIPAGDARRGHRGLPRRGHPLRARLPARPAAVADRQRQVLAGRRRRGPHRRAARAAAGVRRPGDQPDPDRVAPHPRADRRLLLLPRLRGARARPAGRRGAGCAAPRLRRHALPRLLPAGRRPREQAGARDRAGRGLRGRRGLARAGESGTRPLARLLGLLLAPASPTSVRAGRARARRRTGAEADRSVRLSRKCASGMKPVDRVPAGVDPPRMRIRSVLAAALGLPALAAGLLVGVGWWAVQDLAGSEASVVVLADRPVAQPAPAPAPSPPPAPAPAVETAADWWDGGPGWTVAWDGSWHGWRG